MWAHSFIMQSRSCFLFVHNLTYSMILCRFFSGGKPPDMMQVYLNFGWWNIWIDPDVCSQVVSQEDEEDVLAPDVCQRVGGGGPNDPTAESQVHFSGIAWDIMYCTCLVLIYWWSIFIILNLDILWYSWIFLFNTTIENRSYHLIPRTFTKHPHIFCSCVFWGPNTNTCDQLWARDRIKVKGRTTVFLFRKIFEGTVFIGKIHEDSWHL